MEGVEEEEMPRPQSLRTLKFTLCTLTCESAWKRHGLWSMSRVSLAWSRNRTNKRNFFRMNWDRAKW